MTEMAGEQTGAAISARASWLPMMVIALAQIQMAFNVSALPVSIGAIVSEFSTQPTIISTALVVYSLAVAGFVFLGSKIGKIFGSRLVFQVSVILHGLAMLIMAFSRSTTVILQAQAIAGLAAAALVPSLVVLIAVHYKGDQQAQALGLLGASQAAAGVLAFLVIGLLSSLFSWQVGFGIIFVLALGILLLSFRFRLVERDHRVKIDWVGAVLAGLAIILISVGFNNLNAWGLLLASPDAPFNVLGLSPSPLIIVAGVVLVQGFFAWTMRREEQNKTPLLALQVLGTPQERAATYCLFIIAALTPAILFLIPLYIQIIQGNSALETAAAVIPFSLAILASTILVVRLFKIWPPRKIGQIGFIMVAVGLLMLAFSISNDWGAPLVILSLIVIGLGDGAINTLVFNVLVSASPKELAGDVGALRGTTNNLATGLGTAFASVLSIALLSAIILNTLAQNPVISPEAIESQINLNRLDFVSNERLDELLDETDLTPEQKAAAVEINVFSRLRALKISFLVLASIALLAIIPAGRLPDYLPDEVPADVPSAQPVDKPVLPNP